MSDEDEAPGLRAPNTRVGKIKGYLAKPPRGAERMRLNASAEGGGTSVQLGEWEIEEVKPGLAQEILDAVTDHATELRARVTGTLVFLNREGGQVGGTKVVHARPEQAGEDDDSLVSLPSQLTGDANSQAVQAQKQLEVMSRIYVQGIGGMLHTMRFVQEQMVELMRVQGEQLQEVVREKRAASRQAEEFKEAMEAYKAAAESGATDEQTSAAQERMMKILEQVAPLLIAKMSG